MADVTVARNFEGWAYGEGSELGRGQLKLVSLCPSGLRGIWWVRGMSPVRAGFVARLDNMCESAPQFNSHRVAKAYSHGRERVEAVSKRPESPGGQRCEGF